ncbi:hypothetical protein V8F63_02595 [Brevundimonas sp. LF-1]|uniref:hypothetical protein n=1 Tax=Brevundimonas sp. LF-1 TaxID=3126100 RepID=UPI0030E1C416
MIGGAEVVAWLEKFAKADGRIEQVDGHVIRGWAVRLDDIAQSAIVEAWSGGALCSATTTNLFRRDIQDRFGGDGRFGFELSLPAEMARRNGGEVEVEVLGVPIARVRLPPEEQVLDDIAAAARELGEVRALLERLEARLPAAESGLAQPLSDYGAYAAAWRDSGLDAASSSRRGLVVVDAVGALRAHWMTRFAACWLRRLRWRGCPSLSSSTAARPPWRKTCVIGAVGRDLVAFPSIWPSRRRRPSASWLRSNR